jgi:hypothetical protein
VLFFFGVSVAQDTFTGTRGFAPTFKTSQDTPPASAYLSIQIPGNVETNGCIRFSKPAGDVCLCADNTLQQVWHETDCDGTYEGGGEFLLGSSSGFSRTIADAVDAASALSVGDGTVGIRTYGNGSTGILECFIGAGTCDLDLVALSGKSIKIWDTTSNLAWTIDPGNATPNLRYPFAAAYRPLVSAEIVLYPVGDCTASTVALTGVSGAPPLDWITCVDTTGDALSWSYKVTTKLSSDTTIKLSLWVTNTNASPTGTFTVACAAQSTQPNAGAYAAHNTTGQQSISFTTWGADSRLQVASATFTMNGTLSTNSHVTGQCNVTAAPAQIADIRISGTAVIELGSNSLSD